MTFQILLGIFPLGAYLTILGWLRWTRPALVTTGGRDTFALALAAIGLAAIGPGDLFFPAAAGAAFGPIVWPVMMLLYFLIVALWVLHQRPRLVIYGLGDKGLAEPLLRACRQIDPQSKLDPNSGTITMPGSHLHLRLVRNPGGESAEIEAFENGVAPQFWRGLLTSLRKEVGAEKGDGNRQGLLWMVSGASVLLWCAGQLVFRTVDVTRGLHDWLWR
jgi:hypothetical protein